MILRLTMGLMAAAAMVAAGCGGTDATADDGSDANPDQTSDPTTTTTIGTGDGSFTVLTEDFVDESRTTGDQPGRSLKTDIYIPGGEGPFPLVMHAHGMDGTSAKFSELLSLWAEAGYIVVAPNFPLTNGDAPDGTRTVGDFVNQPDDVQFVLDRVLEMNGEGGTLESMIATDHMGISGLSLGGATTYPLLFHPCCEDQRYVSGILMSALELPFAGGEYDYSRRIPILAFAGTADAAIPYDLQQSILAKIAGPLWNVTLTDGQHSQPFENNPAPHDDLVVASTLDFWAMTLRDDVAAGERLISDATVEGLSTVEYKP